MSAAADTAIDERPRELAEVARRRSHGPVGEQTPAEQDDDRDRPHDEREAHEGELEEAESPHSCVVGGLGDDDVQGRPGQGQERARVRTEGEREQEPRGRLAEPHGHGRDDGHERGHGAVHADQRREHGDEEQHEDQNRAPLSPARVMSSCPAQAVTPVASSASLTTKSVAMKITVGSPKPASACSRSRTPAPRA